VTETTTPLGALSRAGQWLEEKGIHNARNEARFMLLDVLGTDMAGLLRDGTEDMAPDALRVFWQWIEERAAGKPLAYILGKECFMGLWFAVDENVLIPRQDTETLVREALACLVRQKSCSVLDLCCGSGAVGIAIAHLKPGAEVTAVDISPCCLEVTRKNAVHNRVQERVRCVCGDLFNPVAGRRFDAIVSNPPYISDAGMGALPRDVKDFEPELALRGGKDGLFYYRRIVAEAGRHLNPDGALVVETGWDQTGDVAEMMMRNGFNTVCVARDPGGRPRVVSGRYRAV
jgi:release factor glutamine methyltransferase